MGLSQEIAKALIIDAFAGWNRKENISHSIGYGIMPTHIKYIVQTSNDEIRFILTGASKAYETYTYNIPVRIYDEKQSFFS